MKKIYSLSDCGYKLDKLSLSIREWVCPNCGVIHDRDINAAINLMKSHKCWGTIKLAEIPLTAERDLDRSTSYGSVKQEAGIGVTQLNPVNAGCQTTG